jgi:hypothetical protein
MALMLVASYVFYGWWDWRFLFLIAFSTLVDYWAGLRIPARKMQENVSGADGEPVCNLACWASSSTSTSS